MREKMGEKERSKKKEKDIHRVNQGGVKSPPEREREREKTKNGE